jgi:E3 ubiquitin-protein ligase NEDD4
MAQKPQMADRGADSNTSTDIATAEPANASTTSNSQAALPPHWEELIDSDGRTYYANHATRTTSWRRPDSEAEVTGRSEDSANAQASLNLPAAWQALVDSEGRTYFANHSTRTTTYDRPEGPTGELPQGWEMLRNTQGVAYFADHNTHTSTWEDPRTM